MGLRNGTTPSPLRNERATTEPTWTERNLDLHVVWPELSPLAVRRAASVGLTTLGALIAANYLLKAVPR